jgi:CubicO group peptidase (beta-lactamase class C family)
LKFFFRTLIGLSLLVGPLVVAGQGSSVNVESIDRIVRAQVDSGFSGVVLVAMRDSILLDRAYAPPREKLRANDAFWIASMTKGFTADAVMRLQTQGRLNVRDSIGRFFRDVPPDKRGITIHQLLTHTAGLGGDYTGGGITDRARAVRAILGKDLIFAPGMAYKYGDDDYELLAAVIEVASGQSWEDYVRAQFVIPLHLESVGFACRMTNRSRHPVGSANSGERNRAAFSRPACDWGHKGANGMFANAGDVLRWSRASMADWKPQVLVRREAPFDVSYGYGVRIYTLNGKIVEIMHSGSGDDDHTSIARNLSTGFTIVVLSNSGQHAGTTWASFIARQLARREGA